jgi:uncharacterized protein (UPF0128 family)
LEVLIEEKKFYPVTTLNEVDKETEVTLGDNGIILLKQLLEADLEKISIKTGIKKEKMERLMKNCSQIGF